jgi:PIN domain nuclease of toxin-antitoxin system
MGMKESAFLLDTHALLWWMADAPELSNRAKHIIEETNHIILVSCATLWEIAIKQRKGILSGLEEYLARYESWHEQWGFGTLDIRPPHAIKAGLLDWSHKDPFDRLLVAQSTLMAAPLITCDENIIKHHPPCVWD